MGADLLAIPTETLHVLVQLRGKPDGGTRSQLPEG
jgi:hypothetical protein